MRRSLSTVLLAALSTAPLFAQSKIPEDQKTLGAEIPSIIARLQMEADELTRSTSTVQEVPVEVIFDRGNHPWALLAAESHGALPPSADLALQWAEDARDALLLEAFELEFAGRHECSLGMTMEFSLRHAGLLVFGSQIQLHWQDGTFQGATAAAPRQLALVEPAPSVLLDMQLEYVPYGRPDGRTDLRLATVERSMRGDQQVTTWRPRNRPPFHQVEHGPIRLHPGPDAALRQLSTPTPVGPLPVFDQPPPMTRWTTPSTVSFPDQIDFDSLGNPWISFPSDHFVMRLRKRTGVWTSISTGSGSMPDGLMVDDNNNVWFGKFGTDRLGRYNAVTGQQSDYPPPISVTNVAVPNRMSNGHVAVTDHGGWLLEFDPANESWVRWDRTLASNPHLVAATEDAVHQELVMTQYFARRLGFRPISGGSITDVTIPGSNSPAFIGADAGMVYFTNWGDNSLGQYDPSSGVFTFHTYPLNASEVGGPLDVSPAGDVISGTRGSGFIAVFTPGLGTFRTFAIPSVSPGLKDGLRVESEGEVWFTESGADRVTRLRYPR